MFGRGVISGLQRAADTVWNISVGVSQAKTLGRASTAFLLWKASENTVKRGVNEREQDVYLARRCVRCLHLLGSSHAQGGFAGIKGSVQVEPSFIHGLLPPNAAAPLRSPP